MVDWGVAQLVEQPAVTGTSQVRILPPQPFAPIVNRLEHRPVTPERRVRLPLGAPILPWLFSWKLIKSYYGKHTK